MATANAVAMPKEPTNSEYMLCVRGRGREGVLMQHKFHPKFQLDWFTDYMYIHVCKRNERGGLSLLGGTLAMVLYVWNPGTVNMVVMVVVYMYKISNRCGCLFVRWLLCRWCWRGLVISQALRNYNQIDWFSYSGYMRGLWRSSWTIEKFSWLQWSKLCVCVCVCVSLS